MLNEKYQCPACFQNDVTVSVTEHRDMYATGDSPTGLEITSTCCGADAVEVGTYCKCGTQSYDDGMCIDCYAEQHEKEEKEMEMKVLGMTVAELLEAGYKVEINRLDVELLSEAVDDVKRLVGEDKVLNINHYSRNTDVADFESAGYRGDEGLAVIAFTKWRDENEKI